MGAARRRFSFAVAVASSVVLASCTSILGVVDLQRDTDDAGSPGSGGAAGTLSTSSSIGGAGGTSAGTAQGGAGGNGGGSGGSDSDASAGSGGSAGGQPIDSGVGDAGVDRDAGPITITVTGKVIDVLRRPYAGVPVAIGNTVTSTDGQGAFQVVGVTPPYDVLLRLSDPLTEGWYFTGLTIASPVLQVNTQGGPLRGQTYLTMNIANPPANFPPANESVGYSWGSPDGWFSTQVTGPKDIQGPSWYGPATAAGAAHVLAWMIDASNLPTSYVGYDTTSLTLQDGTTSEFTVDIAKTHPGTSTLSGSVTLGSLATPHNDVYVTLPKGASIKLVDQDRDPANKNFTYNVPTGVTGASFMICAQAGSSLTWPFALAHKHGLTAGQTGVALTVPDAATPGAPGNNSVVSTSTDFLWSAPTGQQGPVLYTLGFELGDTRPFTYVYVVTSKTTARLPKFPAGFGPIVAPNVSGVWWVETSGYASVDAAATASGFIDPFDHSGGVIGPLDQDGAHAWSAARNLTTSASP